MITRAAPSQLPVSTEEDASADRKQVKLLVVTADTYPPVRVDVTVLFGEELAGRGHRIDWLMQSEPECHVSSAVPWGAGRIWIGPTDLGTSLFHRVRKHVRGIRHDLRLFRLLRGGEYDAIEVKDKFLSGVLAMVAARLYHKKFFYWLSWPYPEEYLLRSRDGTARYPLLYAIRGAVFKHLLYRLLLPAADHVFVQSEQMRQDIAREGLPLARMTAVPMGIKLGNFASGAAVSSRGPIPAGERCFLYLGTLTKVRRMDFLIRVLALVRREVPDARLYLVGRGDDPSDEQLLMDEARRLGLLEAVVFTGQLPREQAFRYVQDADVCVSPFFPTPILNSTSPTKLVEYMALGKAVVANDHPEQRLVIEGSDAGLCVPYEEGAFADAVVALLRDPERARSMGEKGRRYVAENRAYGIIADQVEAQLLRTVFGSIEPT